jgi:hypothetical protein
MTLAVAAKQNDVSPAGLMALTVDALVEVCQTMQEIALEPRGECIGFDAQASSDLECGSTISLMRPGKSWNLALFGRRSACQTLARALLAMEPEEEIANEELADALGEILNMMAGVAKRKMAPEEAKQVQLGLPLFIAGTECFRYLAKGIRVFCQRVAGPAVDVEVILVWKES